MLTQLSSDKAENMLKNKDITTKSINANNTNDVMNNSHCNFSNLVRILYPS